MSENTAPEVRTGEEAPQTRTINGAPTSVLAFPGIFAKGPVRTPQFLAGAEDLKRIFGGPIGAGLGYKALSKFFARGGTGVWASRIVHFTDITDPDSGTGARALKLIDDRVANAGAKAAGTIVVASNAITQWVAATASIIIANNTFASGDKVVVNGEDFEESVDFTAGVDANATAIALAAAINASVAVAISGVITAAVDGTTLNKVNLTAVVKGTGGNSLTLTKTDTGTSNFTLSGAVFTGGVSGDAITVSTTVFKFGVNVTVGGSAAATASNLATAIDALAAVAAAVDGTTATQVNVEAAAVGTAGNSIAFSKTDPSSHFTLAPTGGFLAGGLATDTQNSITVTLSDVGTYGNGQLVRIGAPQNGAADHFKIQLLSGTSVLDTFDNVNLEPSSADYVESRVNGKGKKLFTVTDELSSSTSPTNLPLLGDHALAGGDDGLTDLGDLDFVGDSAAKTGLYAFDSVIGQFALMACPERLTATLQAAGQAYCVGHKKALWQTDTPLGLNEVEAKAFIDDNGLRSEYNEVCWPHVVILDTAPANLGNEITIPSSTLVCACKARVDGTPKRGVAKAAAGIGDGNLTGFIQRLENDRTKYFGVRGLLFAANINPIWSQQGVGPYIDGARLAYTAGLVPNTPQRRVFIFCETSIEAGIQYAKEEPIDETLFSGLNATITVFLTRFWRGGGLKGRTPAEAFYVNTDSGAGTINPTATQDAGEVNVKVGLATKKPAYFLEVLFTVKQDDVAAAA